MTDVPKPLPRAQSNIASSLRAGGGEPSVETQVSEALLRWRTSMVPVEDPAMVGDRRARTLTTIAAAMRQGLLERERAQGRRRWAYLAAAASVLIGLSAAGYVAAGHDIGRVVGLGQVTPGVVGLQATALPATLTGRGGEVWVGAASAEELVRQVPLGRGAIRQLAVGDRVVTRSSGQAGLDVGGDTKVQLQQSSELVLAKNARNEKRLLLKRGVIDIAVKPQSVASGSGIPGESRRSVIVQTPDAMVLVHGTRFTVTVDPAGPSGAGTVTTVQVSHGVVSVMQEGSERARLRAGQSWSSRPSPATRRAADEPAASAGEVDDAPRKAISLPANASRSARAASAGSRRKALVTLPQRGGAAEEPAQEQAVVSSTLQEENRLFRLAVDARNRGDDSSAVRQFGQLLSKYPESALAQEAKVEQFRALKRLGRARDAAREARRYLIEHGNGFAEEEARDVALTPGK